MSPQTDFIDTTTGNVPGRAGSRTWDPRHGVFAASERRTKSIDRTALCVQITLCLVVAALLFSVIAVPKLRASSAKVAAERAAQEASRER